MSTLSWSAARVVPPTAEDVPTIGDADPEEALSAPAPSGKTSSLMAAAQVVRFTAQHRAESFESPGECRVSVSFDPLANLGQERPVVVVADPDAGVRLGEVLEVVEGARHLSRIRRVFPCVGARLPGIVEEEIEEGEPPPIAAPECHDIRIETEAVGGEARELDRLPEERGVLSHPVGAVMTKRLGGRIGRGHEAGDRDGDAGPDGHGDGFRPPDAGDCEERG